ncbi:eukaryotic translation initiation factor 4 gamma 2-like isoform X1 [Halichondria panicea]|uniref:eukaryotic translation initiation factor 4 gamma 2-like isoform X1 n=1 Tax=Halichondria panicea TaxID=6063 RepID=UPI00312B3DCD
MQTLFRKIRGILNKITPDNFDKLSYELTQLPAVHTKEALKGVILLVYEKALEGPHYTYMYAQLCRRLNELVPNFEEPGSQSTTFRKLLLHKCQEEFGNRKASFERRDGLSSEEEEQRGMAKRKMLGNIRFVGELFKIGVLHEAIIHSCIKELLERRRGASIADITENMECLCPFLSTVGGKLDTPRAKGWMDKYFERMHSLTFNPDLPRRIHFMLLDLRELRANKWQPRRFSSQPGPRPIHEIRQEVYHDKPTPPPLKPFKQPPFRGSKYPPVLPQRTPSGDEGFLTSPPDGRHLFSPQESISMEFPTPPPPPPLLQADGGVIKGAEPSKVEKKPLRKLPKAKTGDTVSLRPSLGGLKPSLRQPSHDDDSTGSTTSLTESGESKVKKVERLPRTRDDSSDDEDQPNSAAPLHPIAGMPPRPFGPGYPPHMMLPRVYPRPPMYPITNIPPRPMMYAPPPGPMHPPNSRQRLYGPPPPIGPPMAPYTGPRFRPPPPQGIQSNYGPPPGWVTPPPERPHPLTELAEVPLPPHLERNEPLKVKHISAKTGKKGGASGKKAVKNENEKAVELLIGQLLKSRDLEGSVAAVKLTSVPRDALTTLLITKTLGKSEDDRTRISDLIKQLHSEELVTAQHFLQAVGKVLSSAGDYETSLPQYKTYLAGFMARAIAHDVVEFGAIATTFEHGAHHPTLLVVLQALTTLVGEDTVSRRVRGLKLSSLLPVEYRSHEAITELLEAKKLIFLYPLRHIQTELSAKLRQQDISSVAIYKWIKINVDSTYYHTPEFIMVLTKCILEYVCSESTLAPSVARADNPSKSVVTREKQLMEKFKVLIERFVSDDTQLQISTLYATQTFCHQNNFPKGLLLRLFSYLYSMDVVEEEALLKWREDLSQEYPGKGKALFQVNQWLVLLAEADTSEEET